MRKAALLAILVPVLAGQIVFNPDGSVNYVRGPHEQLSGVSFCPALTP